MSSAIEVLRGAIKSEQEDIQYLEQVYPDQKACINYHYKLEEALKEAVLALEQKEKVDAYIKDLENRRDKFEALVREKIALKAWLEKEIIRLENSKEHLHTLKDKVKNKRVYDYDLGSVNGKLFLLKEVLEKVGVEK